MLIPFEKLDHSQKYYRLECMNLKRKTPRGDSDLDSRLLKQKLSVTLLKEKPCCMLISSFILITSHNTFALCLCVWLVSWPPHMSVKQKIKPLLQTLMKYFAKNGTWWRVYRKMYLKWGFLADYPSAHQDLFKSIQDFMHNPPIKYINQHRDEISQWNPFFQQREGWVKVIPVRLSGDESQ